MSHEKKSSSTKSSWFSNIVSAVTSAVKKIFSPTPAPRQNITQPSPTLAPSQTAAQTISAVDRPSAPSQQTSPSSGSQQFQQALNQMTTGSSVQPGTNLFNAPATAPQISPTAPTNAFEQMVSNRADAAGNPISFGEDLKRTFDLENIMMALPIPSGAVGKIGGKVSSGIMANGKKIADLKVSDTVLSAIKAGWGGKGRLAGSVINPSAKAAGLIENAVAKIIARPGLSITVALAVTGAITGWISVHLWGGHDKKEAREKIDFGVKNYQDEANRFIEEGDDESAKAMLDKADAALEIKNDMLNTTKWEDIISMLPGKNLKEALIEDIKGAKILAESQQVQSENARARIGKETKAAEIARTISESEARRKKNIADEEERWNKIDEERDARRQKEIKEDEERQRVFTENWQKAQQAGREADAAEWQRRMAEQDARMEKKRKEDAEFWEEIFRQQEERRARHRKENKQAWEETQQSRLKFRFL